MEKKNNPRKGKKHTEETKEKISKAMIGNLNAEKYSEEDAIKIFEDALELSYESKYDFLGEIAKEQRLYLDLYTDLVNRFPTLKPLYTMIKRNIEANCYSNTKKGMINTAVGIVNLKSNHKWSDRIETNNTTDITSGGQPITLENLISFANDGKDGKDKS